ncbi:MAG: sensor histidine kinase [Pyrinomonadaceae bacterium]
MTTRDIANLINLLGWTTGLALYAMLLLMALRSAARIKGAVNGERRRTQTRSWLRNGGDALPFATAVLGIVWNIGALATHGLHSFVVGETVSIRLPVALLEAASVSALGFLPAVVVHSALQNLRGGENGFRAKVLTSAAYLLSTLATLMHFARSAASQEGHSQAALYILTVGFALLTAGLFLSTRNEAGWRRAVWAVALAVFAVSALHLSSGGAYDTHHERWYLEIIGHHASLPLALAILYQDYRFAFADLFLKRALALLAFVALVTGAFLLYATWFVPLAAEGGTLNARATGVLLALWVVTGMLYPRLVRWTNWFVEKVVLRRADYAELRHEIARAIGAHETSEAALDETCARLAVALTAREVHWRAIEATSGAEKASAENNEINGAFGELILLPARRALRADAPMEANEVWASAVVRVPMAESPRYEIVIGKLWGGRRLLSDDTAMLESIAIMLARRIDGLRVTHERCEQLQREGEIAKLATQSQLRALRAQINPHFLFNALTTIGYLIQTSPARALETLMRLTDLLRRSLRSTNEWVTLGEELKLVEAYLEIERARFEERLRVLVDVAPDLRGFLVPSFIVQPLVENAVKHGIAPQRAGGEVVVAARLDRASETTMLVVSVKDTGAGTSTEHLRQGMSNGVGLANVEARLRALCGTKSQLRIETAAGAGATIEIRLPARTPQNSVDERSLGSFTTARINPESVESVASSGTERGS